MTVIAMTTALIPANRHTRQANGKKRRQICIISTSTKHTYSRKVLFYNKRTKKKRRDFQIIKMKRLFLFLPLSTLDGSRSTAAIRFFKDFSQLICRVVCVRVVVVP